MLKNRSPLTLWESSRFKSAGNPLAQLGARVPRYDELEALSHLELASFVPSGRFFLPEIWLTYQCSSALAAGQVKRQVRPEGA
jgi:hypothetical protein